MFSAGFRIAGWGEGGAGGDLEVAAGGEAGECGQGTAGEGGFQDGYSGEEERGRGGCFLIGLALGRASRGFGSYWLW